MKQSSIWLALVAILLAFFAFSCGDDDTDEAQSSDNEPFDNDRNARYCVDGSHYENGQCVPDVVADDDDDNDNDNNDSIADDDDDIVDDDDDNDSADDDDDSVDDDDDTTDDDDDDDSADDDDDSGDDDDDTAGDDDDDTTDDDDDMIDGDEDTEQEIIPSSCNFNYSFQYSRSMPTTLPPSALDHKPAPDKGGIDAIAHIEPAPAGFWNTGSRDSKAKDIVMPDYSDNMPLFERGAPWNGADRCYEFPDGAHYLSESDAYDFYIHLVEETLWYDVDQTARRRNVIGLRGTHPGMFEWHGNRPDRFNDTIVLLWKETDGTKNVREFPVNTDTGAYDFGYNASSSIRANRKHNYVNGWHRGYNALTINMSGYQVRDDSNKNGHWDSDRNGWLAPFGAEDNDRTGSGHNIHMGSKNAPLESATVGVWSAGCQVIPGMDNWTEFITSAWTGLDDAVDYYLIDARDISPSVWVPCSTENGSHACPYRIEGFPYEHSANTALAPDDAFDLYNCSNADESGPEVVYLMNIHAASTLSVSVSTENDELYDPDVHILSGDDNNACVARAHISMTQTLQPGRYVLIVDTWVDENGNQLAGPYTLNVDLN